MNKILNDTTLGINAENDLETAGGTPSGKRITQLCSTNNCNILTQNIATNKAVKIPLIQNILLTLQILHQLVKA